MITDRQRELRRRNIGGSDLAAVVELATGLIPGSLSPYKSAADVFWEKRPDLVLPEGQDPPQKETKAQRRGNSIEWYIIGCAREVLAPLTLTASQRRVSKGRDGGIIACNLDAILNEPQEPVEAKSCADFRLRDEFGDAGTDEIPYGYMIQVQGEILVCGPKCQQGHLFAVLGWRIDMEPVHYVIPRNNAIIDRITDAALWFWNDHVLKGVPPKGGETPPEHLLKAIKPDEGKSISLEADQERLVEAFLTHQQMAGLHKKGQEACEMELRNLMREASVARLRDGRTVEIGTTKRRAYEVEAMEYTVLRIKKSKTDKGEA
jgi:predicted phage-related endonuclease